MTNIVTAILSVFTAILTWFVESIGTASTLFYEAETGLTFIGTLSVVGLGIAVVLMLFAMVRSYLKNRG